MTSILMIAARSDGLPWVDGELEFGVNAIGADLLIHRVSSASIAIRLLEKPFDVVWLCGHGGHDGIELPGDVMLSSDTFATALRGHPVKVVVLNTCEGHDIAHRLYGSLGVPIVYTDGEVEDQSAFVMSLRFVEAMANGQSYREAFNTCAGTDFHIVPERPVGASDDVLTKILEELQQLSRRVSKLEDSGGLSGGWFIVALAGGAGVLLWFITT